MTGPEHYREAERLLKMGAPEAEPRAQVHATLALVAATVHPIATAWTGTPNGREWTEAVS